MSTIALKSYRISKNRIEYDFICPDAFSQYLVSQTMYVEYPQEYDLSTLPTGTLMIPFVGNILTASMFFDYSIEVDELDKTFHECLPEVRRVFKTMYPYLDLHFNVKATLTDCSHEALHSSVFFTGGVDATSALAEVAEQSPMLINIWGGDVQTHDNDTHEALKRYLTDLCQHLNIHHAFIKSNCREMYGGRMDYVAAARLLPAHNHGWWASFAHILSMLSIIAPLCWQEKISHHYIGSTYDAAGSTFDANNKAMADSIRFGSTRMSIVDDMLTRTQKIGKIIAFSQQHELPIDLKVCWYRTAATNCSRCEKCYRTILDIILNGGDPNALGFSFHDENWATMRDFLNHNHVNEAFWVPIQNVFRSQRDRWSQVPKMAWFLDYELNSFLRKNRRKRIKERIRRIGSALCRAFRKITKGATNKASSE